MNKILKSIVIVAVIAIAFGATSAVFAQSTTPGEPVQGAGMAFGSSGQGARGARGGMLNANVAGTQDGLLHDVIIAAYADELGISVADLEARILGGETMSEIAISTGLTVEQFLALKVEVRAIALDQAVLDGTLTQGQADWLKTRGTGIGSGNGTRGNGQGLNGTGDCILD